MAGAAVIKPLSDQIDRKFYSRLQFDGLFARRILFLCTEPGVYNMFRNPSLRETAVASHWNPSSRS